MTQKGFILVLAFACLSAAAAAAAPKVAVLDAVLPEKMDINVAIGVTEKISEELVGSGRFTVLDRTTVGQSLKEIEFQMSGMVSDEQIKRAGEQLNSRLGAAYVVVSRVSVVGETYFVTAKMIDIKTGEITAQASAEQEGKIAVTLKIAQAVGKKLAGGVREPEQAVKTELAEEKPKPEKAPAQGEPERAVTRKLLPRSRILVSYLVPVLGGEAMDILASYIGTSTLSTVGLHIDWKQFVARGVYASMLVTLTNTTVEWYNTSTLTYVTDPYLTTLDLQGGVGWAFPLGKALQGSVGLQGGLLSFTLGDFWLLSVMDELSWCATLELGLDWFLFKSLALGTRLSYTVSQFPDGGIFVSGDGSPIGFGYLGISLGVGWAY